MKRQGGRGQSGRSKSNRPSNAPKKGPAKPKKAAPKKQEGIRLNKYIANSGVCSRREADMYIATGQVSVNSKVINEMGYRVKPGDVVKFDGRTLNPEPPTFVLLNKPKGVATTDSSAKGLTVMDLIANATRAKVKPFGRLGRNATGLLLFTQRRCLPTEVQQKRHRQAVPHRIG